MDDPRVGQGQPARPGKRALVAHADAGARARLAGLVRSLGYEPVEAPDADAGREVLRGGEVAVALLSVRLPGMGGRLEFLEQVRPLSRDLPIILIGESGAMKFPPEALGEAARGLPAVDGYLGEPVRGDELAFLLHKVVRAGTPHPQPRFPEGERPQGSDPELAHRRHLQRLALLGRLLGAVAHDLDDLLTAIMGFSTFLQERLDRDDPSREPTEEIHKAGTRAAALTRRLMALGRPETLGPRPLHLNALLADMQHLFQALLPRDVALVVEPEPALGLVCADPAPLQLAVVALVLVAGDALPRGGTLTLRTANRGRGQGSPLPGLADPWPPAAGACVELTAGYAGYGAGGENRQWFLDPLGASREEGAGLALTVVTDIVRQSGGRTAVAGAPGRGTAVIMLLPRLPEAGGGPQAATGAAAPTTSTAAAGRAPPTILVVEDHPGVRALVSEVLRQAGYAVLEAQDGAQGLETCRSHRGAIHLLVTDVIMPQLDGRQLARQLSSLRPDLRVLFTSGHAAGHQAEASPAVAFLPKPFTPDQLLRTVRSLLPQTEE